MKIKWQPSIFDFRESFKILVCGSRTFSNREEIYDSLYWITKDSNQKYVIVEGEAPGADTLAREYGEENGLEVKKYPAEWSKYGRKAGYMRNKQMLDENPDIDIVLAFIDKPLKQSKGTYNMYQLARSRGIEVCVIPDKGVEVF